MQDTLTERHPELARRLFPQPSRWRRAWRWLAYWADRMVP